MMYSYLLYVYYCTSQIQQELGLGVLAEPGVGSHIIIRDCATSRGLTISAQE